MALQEGCLPYSKHREGAGKSKKQERAHTLCLLCKIPSFFFFTGSISLELEHAPASKGLQYATGVECFPRCRGQPLNYTIIGMKRQHSFGCSTEIQQTQLQTGQMHNHQYMVLSPDWVLTYPGHSLRTQQNLSLVLSKSLIMAACLGWPLTCSESPTLVSAQPCW